MITNLRSVKILMLLWLTLLTAVLFVFVFLVLRPFLWHPFGAYPVQTITAARGADGIPIVKLSEGIVPVLGTKCITKDNVRVAGESQWRKEEQNAVTIIAGAAGSTLRRAGCVTRAYNNVMPDRLTTGVWKITGHEIATGDGWLIGVQEIATWETEPFRVIE